MQVIFRVLTLLFLLKDNGGFFLDEKTDFTIS